MRRKDDCIKLVDESKDILFSLTKSVRENSIDKGEALRKVEYVLKRLNNLTKILDIN